MPFATKSYDAGSFLKYKSDFTVANTEYHGYADPTALTSSQKWKVFRVTLNSDGTTAAIDFMNGTNAFSNIWDNRISLGGVATVYS